MFENKRTTKLAILGATALVLGLFAVAPAFAWSQNQGTTIQCYAGGVWSTCASQTAPASSSIRDDYKLGLDGYTCYAPNCGTISFYVVSGAAPGTCPSSVPAGATAEGSATVPSSAVPTSPTAGTWYYSNYYSLSPTLASGSYYWLVYYNAGSSGYASQTSCTEAFTGSGYFPPPTGVPLFPLGMALVLALAIPGLLLIRSKYTSKQSSFPV